jgi:hypothetical protein
MYLKYETAPTPMGTAGEERNTAPAQAMGVPLTSRQYRYLAPIVPAPGDLTFPADGIMVTVNANVTLTLADDPDGTPILLPLLAGVQYDLAIAKVTIVSAGTAYALYHRKPAAP